jgi:predicted glycosyltransferase
MNQLLTTCGSQTDVLPDARVLRAPKILLYSHDTVGLGNIRRTLLLAETLTAEYPEGSAMIVTGSPVIHEFRIPERTDYVKLPCLERPDSDQYRPTYLKSQTSEVAHIRRGMLKKIVLGFAPDLIVVDKRAGGIDGELLEPLRAVRDRLPLTKIVLGLRDILDEPQKTRRSLKKTHDMATIARYYDEVWIYGERTIFDAVTEYGFPPDVAEKTRFCGYLKRPTRPRPRHEGPPAVLVTTGGGGDGTEIIEAYLEGLIALPRSVALRTTIVFGPQMPAANRARLHNRFVNLHDVAFLEFEPDLTSRYATADLVVSMAGYNTVCELLSWSMRGVLVPRCHPVGEQLLRARLLAARGMFDLIEPPDLTPERLMATVLAALKRAAPAPSIDLDAVPRICRSVRALLGGDEA